MNKTININLAGIIFHLDEQAYEAFKTYLMQVKEALLGQEGGAEVVADIEARIAEIFTMRLEEYSRQVVSETDVEFVISTLGLPEDFADDEDEFSSSGSKGSGYAKGKRRFYRNPDEKIIGGVASGIASYFSMDPIWIRILFLILLFFTGIGFITYVILWAAIPEAKTTAQKLQMRGEPVNLSNIEKSVKEELDGVKERFSRFQEKNNGNRITDMLNSFFNFVLSILESIFTFIFKFFGGILAFLGIIVAFALVLAIIGVVGTSWNFGWDFVQINGNLIGMDAATAVLGSGLKLNLLRTGSILTLLLPLFILVVLVAKLAGRSLPNGKILSMAGGISFFIGLGLIIYSGTSVARDFQESATEMERIPLQGSYFDLQADLLEDNDAFIFEVSDDKLRIEDIRLNIKPTRDSAAALVLKHKARGRNHAEARSRAQLFNYPIDTDSEILVLSEYFSVPKEALYRAQQLRATLYLPIGAQVFLDPSIENIIFDVDNVYNMRDNDMIGHTWEMQTDGLVCLDCDELNYYRSEDIEAEEKEFEEIDELQELEEEMQAKIEELELELRRLKDK